MKSKNFHHYKKPSITGQKMKKTFLSLSDLNNLLSYYCCTDCGETCVSGCTVCNNCPYCLNCPSPCP